MAVPVSELVALAGSQAVARGRECFAGKQVRVFDIDYDTVFAEVSGSNGNTYSVSVEFVDSDWSEIAESYCTCPSYDYYTGMCKHIIATVLEANARYGHAPDWHLGAPTHAKPAPAKSSDYQAQDLVQHYAQMSIVKNLPRPATTEHVRIECTLNWEHDSYYSDEYYVTFKMGAKKLYVVKNLAEFAHRFKYRDVFELAKNTSLLLDYNAFEPESQEILEFILRHQGEIRRRSEYYDNLKKALYLSEELLDTFFTIVADSSIVLSYTGSRRKTWNRACAVTPGNPPLSLSIKEEGSGFNLSCTPFDALIAGNRCSYVLMGTQIYCADAEYTYACLPLLQSLERSDSPVHYYAPNDVPALLSSVIPYVKPFIKVDFDKAIESHVPKPLVAKAHFDLDEENAVLVHLVFSYGKESFDAFSKEKYLSQSFDLSGEIHVEHVVSQYMGSVLRAEGTLIQKDEEAIYLLFSKGFAAIGEVAEVYLSEALKHYQVRPPISMSIGVRIEGRLLEIDLDLTGLDFEELAQVINSYRHKKKYHRMRDGSFLGLEDDALAQIVELGENLSVSDAALAKGHVSLDINRSLYLDAMLKQNEELRYARDTSFKDIVRKMNSIEDADYSVPPSLQSTLRNYQIVGYQWAQTLRELGFGGILADDMGLGKTIQVLTLLQALKEEGCSGTSLIVCPASLVYNWQSEAARFTPQLRTCAVAGSASQRAAQIVDAAQYDILITSYDLAKRDIAQYEAVHFAYIVLDEAQYIKNQNTQNAKAVKLLKGDHRLALTGTPIENSLAELWSAFDFLMPGYLLSYSKFKQRFETPIAKYNDEAAANRLRALIRPFILRRLKSDVLKELPEKMEQTRIAAMGNKQRKLYLATLAQSKADLSHKLQAAGAGAGQSRILILSALMRLRQICCDPALVYEDYDGTSAKLDMCMELLKSCIDSGHRVVLFSQFTSMLAIIKERLSEEDIAFCTIQGSTPKMERLSLVEQFNADTTPVFLVSLRAGGTGLNLIGADTVIHYDPWWNQSVQNQATDRTHRIGQTKHVQVYKLIMKDTIEERIQELQAAKAELADRIIQAGENVFDSLTSEELVSLLEE